MPQPLQQSKFAAKEPGAHLVGQNPKTNLIEFKVWFPLPPNPHPLPPHIRRSYLDLVMLSAM